LFAKLFTSTPEPDPRLVIKACAAALAALLVLEVPELVEAVLLEEVVLVVEELAPVPATLDEVVETEVTIWINSKH